MARLVQSRMWMCVKWLSALAVLCAAALVQAVPAGSSEEIRERTRPVGQVCRAGQSCGGIGAPALAVTPQPPPADEGGMTGEQVYRQSCFACHATGVSGAPRLADAESWAPRIAKGLDALVATTVSGVNLMPPRGACMSCSDDDLRAAVEYMVESTR